MADKTIYDLVDINGNLIEDNLCSTSNSHGLMCPEDKIKLAGIEAGAQVNIITSASTEFNISDDKQLSLKSVDMSKVTGLTDTLNGYLPLSGGTVTGNLRVNGTLSVGSSGDFYVTENGNSSLIVGGTGSTGLTLGVNTDDQSGNHKGAVLDGHFTSKGATVDGKLIFDDTSYEYPTDSRPYIRIIDTGKWDEGYQDLELHTNGDFRFGYAELREVGTPTTSTSATNKSYVDSLISNTVKLTGDQVISGTKTFSDNTQFGSQIWIGDECVIKEDGTALTLIGGNSGANITIGDIGTDQLKYVKIDAITEIGSILRVTEQLQVPDEAIINKLTIKDGGDILVDNTELESLWSQI